MMKTIPVAVAALAMSLLASSAQAGDPAGLWLTEDGAAKIKLAKCGANVCGSIAWLKDPNDSNGKPKTDKNNVDASKRSRPIIGVPIVLSMKPDGTDKWSGRIYNAEDGKTYSASLTLAGNNMQVRGCVSVFCKTKTWTRTN